MTDKLYKNKINASINKLLEEIENLSLVNSNKILKYTYQCEQQKYNPPPP